MKTNLKRKLALSATALGVVGISLTASTYAWLTSNSIATTKEVSGSTGADKNLFIMGDADDHFSNKAAFKISNTFEFTNATRGNGDTKDLTADNNQFGMFRSIVTPEKDSDVTKHTNITFANEGTEQTKGVMKFNVKFQAPVNSSVYLKSANITSTGERAFTLKADAGTVDAAKKGKKLTAKLEDALVLATRELSTTGSEVENSVKHIRNTATTAPSTLTGETSIKTGYSAVTYYNNIMTTAITAPTLNYAEVDSNELVLKTSEGVKALEESVKLFTTPSAANDFYNAVEDEPGKLETSSWVTFYLYLDGWDNECFDAITNQNLTASFEFELKTGA